MISSKKLAIPLVLFVCLQEGRALVLGQRDHGQDDGSDEGPYAPPTSEPLSGGVDGVWPTAPWTSPILPAPTWLTDSPARSSSTSLAPGPPGVPPPATPATALPTTRQVTSTTSRLVLPTTDATPPARSSSSLSSSSVLAGTKPSATLITAIPSSTPSAPVMTLPSASQAAPSNSASSSNDTSGLGSNRTLVIVLSSVLSAVGALLIIGAVLLCWRYRQRRRPFFSRGISPIDDDEIATWKVPRQEKPRLAQTDAEGESAAAAADASSTHGHAKHASTSSKKPPSVIIYNNASGQGRPSAEGSPRSLTHGYASSYYGKTSFDKELPQTPIQARAPNARAGLTDESLPGDDPFVASHRRQNSRISKPPPSIASPRSAHTRTRSSRSSTRSFGEYGAYSGSSEAELSPRGSQDYFHPYYRGHSRVYSSSGHPPRLSLGDDGIVSSLSPRPLFRDEEIGRAIG